MPAETLAPQQQLSQTDPICHAEHTRRHRALERPLLGRLVEPIGLAAAGVGSYVLLHAVFDPFTQDIPLCPVYRLTGILCPGCGMTRAAYALASGDIGLAVRNNAVLVLALPVLAWMWIRWVRARVQRRPVNIRIQPRWVYLTLVVVFLYTIARNLPWLYPIIGPTSLIGA
ncbi:DUF2752 domain-containing protein [Devriesea agamarum]|uniref:DUF2752 domain-containing protein n=1 Tax=Devriesea agamarum TaxID=472569 RepID=UPI00071DC712|nr:DUF2752 domain-containing protein [Devriesea agamarum]